MREVPTSLLDEMIVEVILTTGTIIAPTTEKAGTGGATIVTTSEASALATTTMR